MAAEKRKASSLVNKKSTKTAARTNAIMIADAVGTMIETRVLKQGEHIREQALADHFGTSRGPVREALKILESRFQIEIVPNVGAIVPRLSPEEIVEIHDLRGAILGVAAKWAATRATEEELRELVTKAKQLRKMANGNYDPDTFVSATNDWRHLLVKAAHSKRLERNYAANGFGAVSFIWATSWATRAKREKVAQDWIECAQALEARNGERAKTITLKLYNRTSRELERFAQGFSMSQHF